MRLSKGQLKRIIREEYSRLKRRGLIKEMNASGYEGGSNSAVEQAIEDIAMIISMESDVPNFGKALSNGMGNGQMETAGIRLSKALRKEGVFDGMELEHDMVLDIVEYIFREDRGGKYYSKAQQVLSNLHAAGFSV